MPKILSFNPESTAAKSSDRYCQMGLFMPVGYSASTLSLLLDVFTSANQCNGQDYYQWRLFSAAGGLLHSSSEIQVSTDLLPQHNELDLFIACPSLDVEDFTHQQSLWRIRQLAASGVRSCSIGASAFLLARAGLLDGHRVAIDSNSAMRFRRDFPAVSISHKLFEKDRDRLSCADDSSLLEMLLGLIAGDLGDGVAKQVTRLYQHHHLRCAGQHEQLIAASAVAQVSPRLARVIAIMENNIETPLPLQQIAQLCHMSLRQMQRLFRQYLCTVPGRYYLQLRLNYARDLLLNTNRRIIDISVSAGFETQSHFTSCFKEMFGQPPRLQRVLVNRSANQGAFIGAI